MLAEFVYYLGQPEDVAVLAESYMKILSFSIIPVMIFQTYRQFIEGLGNTKPAMYLNIIANIVNAFGNWVLIYGNLGFPRLELDGAGIASLNTRIFLGVAMLIYVMYSKKYKEYDPSLKFHSINIPVIKNCEYCDEEFTCKGRSIGKKYCNIECRHAKAIDNGKKDDSNDESK